MGYVPWHLLHPACATPHLARPRCLPGLGLLVSFSPGKSLGRAVTPAGSQTSPSHPATARAADPTCVYAQTSAGVSGGEFCGWMGWSKPSCHQQLSGVLLLVMSCSSRRPLDVPWGDSNLNYTFRAVKRTAPRVNTTGLKKHKYLYYNSPKGFDFSIRQKSCLSSELPKT